MEKVYIKSENGSLTSQLDLLQEQTAELILAAGRYKVAMQPGSYISRLEALDLITEAIADTEVMIQSIEEALDIDIQDIEHVIRVKYRNARRKERMSK